MLLPCLIALGTATATTPAPRAGIDVLDYEFRIEFPARPPASSITGSATVTFARASADTLVLDLLAPMQVSDVRVGGATARYVRDSTTVRIALPAGRGDTLRAEVRYAGTPTDGLVIGTDATGRWTAFGDNYPNRARHWLPTVDDPADKATVTWDVRAPVGVRVIANGALVEESAEPVKAGETPMMLTRWRADRPLYTSVMVIGVASFAVFELGNTACGLGEHPGCVPQSVWVAPEVRSTMPGAFARAGDIVKFFSQIAGPFPYEKLAHVQSATRWGGMENAGAIFYADGIFRKNTMSEGLIAHETAHQWFGDAVTERTWPDVWLSEGFATYFAALWTEHSKGDSAFRADLREMRKDVLDAKITVDEPVVRRDVPDMSKLLNSNVYQKAGFTLHMLRRQVGDSAFFRGVRAYYAKHRHGNATTADFKRELEATSGMELGWFFEQWMHRPGFAVLDAQWRYDAARHTVVVTVSQSERFPPYRLTIPVEVTTQSGKTYRAKLAVPATRVGTVPLDLTLDGEPRSVVFDPDVSVLGTITAR